MPRHLVSAFRFVLATGGVLTALALTTQLGFADSVAHTPTFSGNAVAALFIIAIIVGTIYMLIAGALHVERRDARLGRGRSRRDEGWYGVFPAQAPDDEDAPDYHYHGGDGDGGGEGGS